MPFTTLGLQESYQAITRPVVKEIIAHILQLTNLPADTPIFHVGSSNTAALENSTMEESLDQVRFSQKQKIFIQVSEKASEQTELTMQSTKPEGPPVFFDQPRGVVIRPIYSPTTVTISVKFRANDQVAAESWRNGLRRKIAEDLMAVSHEIQYQYLIPNCCIGLLHEIYTLKETIDPDNEKLSEWFKRCWTNGATTVTKMDTKHPRIGVNELQTDVIGFFDFTSPPEHDKHEEGSAWEISFDYEVRFDKPTALQVVYPVIVHQQLLDEKWFHLETSYKPWLRPDNSSFSRRAFDGVINQTKPIPAEVFGGLQYPKYDDWYPPMKQMATNTILRVLCSIAETDRTYIEKFDGFGLYDINPRFLAFMQKHYRYLFKKEESPFVLELWDGTDRIDPSQIEVNEELEIRTKFELSLRNTYHLRFCALMDLSLLSDAATMRFRTEGQACIEFLQAICPNLENVGLVPTLTSNGMVRSEEYWAAVRYIATTNRMYRSKYEVVRARASGFVIEADQLE